MKDKKELLQAKLELSDEQLDRVEGGAVLESQKYYALCLDCGWRSDVYQGSAIIDVVNSHRNQTGHMNFDFNKA